MLDNAITPLEERAELGVRPDPEGVKAIQRRLLPPGQRNWPPLTS